MSEIQPESLPEQTVSTSSFDKVSEKNLVNKVFFIFLGVILLLAIAGGSYYLGTKQQGTQNQTKEKISMTSLPTQQENQTNSVTIKTPSVFPSPTADPTASWQLYTNAKYNFSIRHPFGLSPNEQSTYYFYVEFKDPSASGTLPPYLVSVIPDTFVAKDVAAYNYMSSDWINNISSLQIGETKTMDSAATFTRLKDMAIAGQDAVSIRVQATGFNQVRTYVKKNGYIYMISNYYQPGSDVPLYDYLLFASSFKFLQ